jgi:hypothetical protein
LNYQLGLHGRLLCVYVRKGDKNVRLVLVNGSGRRYTFLCPPNLSLPPFPCVVEFSGLARWVGSTKDGTLAYFQDFAWQEFRA